MADLDCASSAFHCSSVPMVDCLELTRDDGPCLDYSSVRLNDAGL